MRLVCKLTKADIKKIIAEKFEVPLTNVYLECFNEAVGYGPNETTEPSVRAEVEIKRDLPDNV